MAERTKHEPGTFSWVELATRDGAAAKRFYTSLFGWGFDDMPVGDGTVYTMLTRNGKQVGALYQMSPQQQGVPPHWNSYVSVASADDAAAKAKTLGGTVMLEPFDVLDAGRMAIVSDPTGAVFSLWRGAQEDPADTASGEEGGWMWNELWTNDPDQALSFYERVIGYTVETMDMGDQGKYHLLKTGDKGRAGVTPSVHPAAPSMWLPYVQVADCDAKAAQAARLGGQVMFGPADIPGIGRFAILQDPAGAALAIMKPAPEMMG
jgi:predicted enzyme related to lactoylglutathione lyase